MEIKFFNLIERDISELTIERNNYFECVIRDKNNSEYEGFILAKSPIGKAYTICEITFQKSATDGKYQPRLVFKRTDKEFNEKNVAGKRLTQRISFKVGNDGYREFWKMISFLAGFKKLVDIGNFAREYKVVSDNEFAEFIKIKEASGDLGVFKRIIDESEFNSTAFFQSVSTLKLLKAYRDKLNEFIIKQSNEKAVQNWIDEDQHKYRQERCMIFGLEFINHKREGGVSGNRYDLLTRIGSEAEERILIELKSPGDDIFNIKEKQTINGVVEEYSLSDSLARAIPQILEYKKNLEEKQEGDPDLQRIGETNKVKINKCIIIIGANKDNSRWQKNVREFRCSLNSVLEVLTYTDLYNKLDSTIKNIEQRFN